MLASFIVLCLTGGICDYVNDDTMEQVKLDMKKRLLLRKWDALTIKWFRRHENIKTVLNVLSFFTFVYALYAWQEQVMSWAFDIRPRLVEGLPSLKQGVITYPSKLLAKGLQDENIQRMLENATCVSGICDLDDFHDELTRQDEAYLASEMAVDCYEDLMGNPTSVLVSESVLFWYYAMSVFGAIVVLRMMGHRFWSI